MRKPNQKSRLRCLLTFPDPQSTVKKTVSPSLQRGLCCFPGLANPISAQRKGKLPKPLLASVTVSNGGQTPFTAGSSTFFTSSNRHENGEMMLLEKQGRSSQQQRMADTSERNQEGSNVCPSPSSLPRPPRSSHRSGLPRRIGEYNRLDNNEPQRKNSNGADSLSSNASSRRASPARSMIQPPRKLGEYGRLSESGGSSASLRKSTPRVRSGSNGNGERDSASTLSENSASSLPTPSKLRMYGAGGLRRGNSLGRESKSSADPNKYRIQFWSCFFRHRYSKRFIFFICEVHFVIVQR